ncbi:acetyl-CoA carboxylase biotin carboxyl carrier protein [Jeotgalibacillus sp. S-D1]|uniref:acetyl-CoA carboxylase biotin carboxyl carrier protein n=1 Tax=Jeotgalibacillus sp. S-D1 TaxID=2552189 RepID=UPI00105A338E|nr:acetyl-CoA carboxylase biotin carboxyl carrier protein [Jeotgalibacillus sp. S-D1]TDL34624.1 acetyl-CoA carboxylase biotin carboxyl carrier protein [Jeotgalibacillus sp. S-D1]
MLKVQEIRELIKLIDQSSIDEFTYEHDGEKIKMKKQTQSSQKQPDAGQLTVPQSAPAEVAEIIEQKEPQPKAQKEAEKESVQPVSHEGTVEIKSPMVGTFYHASSPELDPYVKVGSKVSEDSTVCIVEAMKLFNEIEAEVSGEIVEILVKDGQLVEYGQPLFLVKE